MASMTKCLLFLLIMHIIAVILFLTVKVALTRHVMSHGSRLTYPGDSSDCKGTSIEQTLLHVKKTKNGMFTNVAIKPEGFQPVDNKQAWMYSAFFDHVAEQQGKPVVRLIGMAESDFLVKIYCNFNAEDKNFTSTGHIVGLPESHGMKYLPSYAECRLPCNVWPKYVSISFQASQEPTNRFQILYPRIRSRNFTVCCSVLHSQNNMASQLIQSIEMNKILGAEHFFVYNYSISQNIDNILRHYQEDGVVTILQWPLPTLESHYFAQVAALNDCFHRNRNISRFVVAVDTDEFIIPRNHTNWMELIKSVSPLETDISPLINSVGAVKNRGVITGCFQVLSSYFSNDMLPDWQTLSLQFHFTEEEKTNIMKYKMLTLSQFWREIRIFPPRDRSKIIARPEFVYITGIHFVHSFTNAKTCHNINDKIALLHHYRMSDLKTGIAQDTSILKFKHTMYPRYMEQYKRFSNIFH